MQAMAKAIAPCCMRLGGKRLARGKDSSSFRDDRNAGINISQAIALLDFDIDQIIQISTKHSIITELSI